MSKPSKGKIHRGVISIVGTTNLKPGDEVVVVQPLRTPVLSSRTGRILGMDEKVLGRGTVVKAEDALKVQLDSVGHMKAEFDKRQTAIKGIKRLGVKSARTSDVLIKLVNTRMK